MAKRLAMVGGLLLALLAATPASAAPPKIQVTAPLLQFARPGSFVPIHVDIQADEPFDAEVEAKFIDGSGDMPGITREFHVARGSRKRVVVPLPVPDWGSEVFVSIRSGRGAPIAARKLPIHSGAMQRHALRVAVVGEEPLGWPLLGQVTPMPVPGHPDVARDDGYRNVMVQNLMPPDLPDHWFGYSSVDILVWRRPDPAGISAEQQEALRGWLAAGGTAVVSLGDNHANWTASPLADLAPMQTLGLAQSRSALNAVWEIAGTGLPPGVTKGGEDGDEVGLPLVEVDPGAGVEARLSDPEGRPLVLRSPTGAGRLVMLTFDVGAGELRGGFDRALFWRRLLGLWEPEASADDSFGYNLLFEAQPGIVGPPVDVPSGTCAAFHEVAQVHSADAPSAPFQYDLRSSVGASSSPGEWWSGLASQLAQFAAASPLSLTFIVVFGLLYLFFIGPFDYLVLRKAGRPMLTWLTFPVLAIGFSVAASVVISKQKAGDSETHCLTMLDVMPGPGVTRGSSFCAIWASRRDDVQIASSRGKGWVLPSRHQDFDPSGGYYGYTEAITGEDQVMTARSGQAIFGFEAAQWSTSNLRSTWVEASDAGADWYLAGAVADGGSWVRNRTGVDLVDAWVVDGADWYRVGQLPDGAAREATASGQQGPVNATWTDDEHGALWGWALEPVEDRVGHLHAGNPGQPLLIGFAAEALGQPEFDGLRATDSSVTLVRVQLTSPYAEDAG